MATTRTFQAMLNEYLPNKLLKEEMVKRDWILQNVEMDNSWLGGGLIVPFKGQQASSVAFGALTAESDIAESAFVRGEVSTQPEAWGSLKFNHRDIMEHGKLSEQNFLKILPDEVEDFLEYMKEVVSLSFLNGTYFATLTADGDASGNITVDRPERFQLKQKIYLIDDNTTISNAGYVQSINIDTAVITVDTTRAGGTDLDLSDYTVAQNAKVYFQGSSTSGFTSLKSSLLSSTNGGDATLYGQTKTSYPYLQAINVSGSATTATTILQDIFDGYTTVKNRGKGNPSTVLMSYKHLGEVMTILEQQKGAYHIVPDSTKVNAYGWTEIIVFGVKGRLRIVGIHEMDDAVIYYLDMRAMKIYSNGGFRKRISPEGLEYFQVRATTGYSYIVDTCFFGDLVLLRPSYCGIIHSLST